MEPADWTTPGAHLVTNGVYRIPLPLPSDGLKAVNVYALVSDDDLTLIDAGWALDAARTQLDEALATLGREVRDINRFLITHAHRDHYTQAAAIRRECGTHVALGIHEQDSMGDLSTPGALTLTAQLDVLIRCGAEAIIAEVHDAMLVNAVKTADWALPDAWITDGDELATPNRTLTAVHTPGHTRGHVVFADFANALLFAGDHILPHITPSIGFEKKPGVAPLQDYLNSLERIAQLADLRLLPAHGPVTDSCHERVTELQHHHKLRLQKTHEAVQNGATTAFATAQQLTWTRREYPFKSLDAFNSMLATIETAHHLDVLVLRGQLSSQVVDGVTQYTV